MEGEVAMYQTFDSLAGSGSVLCIIYNYKPHVNVNSPPEAAAVRYYNVSFFHFCTRVMHGHLKIPTNPT